MRLSPLESGDATPEEIAKHLAQQSEEERCHHVKHKLYGYRLTSHPPFLLVVL